MDCEVADQEKIHFWRRDISKLDWSLKDNLEKNDAYWKRVLWSDEIKLELFGHRDVAYVWSKKRQVLNTKNTVSRVKHGGGSVMLWGCFSAFGAGNLVRVEGIIKTEDYEKILKDNLKQSATKHGLGFQHDNDPKHTSLLVKNYLQMSKVNILDWPTQSPDLNPIENLWGSLKTRVHARRPTNLEELERFAKEEWTATPRDTCLKQTTKGCYHKKRETPLTINIRGLIILTSRLFFYSCL